MHNNLLFWKPYLQGDSARSIMEATSLQGYSHHNLEESDQFKGFRASELLVVLLCCVLACSGIAIMVTVAKDWGYRSFGILLLQNSGGFLHLFYVEWAKNKKGQDFGVCFHLVGMRRNWFGGSLIGDRKFGWHNTCTCINGSSATSATSLSLS